MSGQVAVVCCYRKTDPPQAWQKVINHSMTEQTYILFLESRTVSCWKRVSEFQEEPNWDFEHIMDEPAEPWHLKESRPVIKPQDLQIQGMEWSAFTALSLTQQLALLSRHGILYPEDATSLTWVKGEAVNDAQSYQSMVDERGIGVATLDGWDGKRVVVVLKDRPSEERIERIRSIALETVKGLHAVSTPTFFPPDVTEDLDLFMSIPTEEPASSARQLESCTSQLLAKITHEMRDEVVERRDYFLQ